MKKIISFSVLIFLLIPAWASAASNSTRPFSADLYYQERGAHERLVMRFFHAQDKIRIERTQGDQNAGIVRMDKDLVWTLNHRRQVYWEIPLAPIPEIHLLDLDGITLRRTRLGRERRNGVPCEKLRVRYEDPQSGQPRVATAWFGINQGTYVRIEKTDGTVFNLRNIRTGPQPSHLFEAPRHYRLKQQRPSPGYVNVPRRSQMIYGPPWYGRPSTMIAYPNQPPDRRVPVLRDGRLFENSDFEDGTLHNWTARGDAFRFQPTRADNPRKRHSNRPSGHQNRYWIATYEKNGARSAEHPGRIQGNRPTGTLTSIPFVITHDRIDFLIGGGRHASEVYVALLIDGKVVRRAAGGNSETMRPTAWHVSQYAGRKARILIADKATRHGGHINADNFRYSGRTLVDVKLVGLPRARRAVTERP